MKKSEIEIDKQLAPDDPPVEAEPLVPLEPATITPEQLEELKDRAARADENWERLLRTTADFENFKKRVTREKQEAIRYANEGLLQKLVPVLDNFDMALSAAQSGQTEAAQSLQAGINMIYQQFKSALVDAGLEAVAAAGKPCHANLHEAVSQPDSADVPDGH